MNSFNENKKILNIITYPGSGTHLLIDILSTLEIRHNPLLDLIVKIIIFNKNEEKNFNELGVKRKRIFLKIFEAIKKANAFNDHKIFSDILKEKFLIYGKSHSYIMQPHIFFKGNAYSLSIIEMDFINSILGVLAKDNNLINLVYLRNPNDIFYSKISRFIKNDDNIEKEIEANKISSFYNYNYRHIISSNLKYEDLTNNPNFNIKKIVNIFGISEKDYRKKLSNFLIYNSSKNYPKIKDFSQEINFINKIYLVVKISTLKRFIKYIKKNYFQLKVVYNFLIKGITVNEGAYYRSERTLFVKVFLKIINISFNLRKRNNFSKNEKKSSQRKNLLNGI